MRDTYEKFFEGGAWGDWQLFGVVETIFGCLCVMACVFFPLCFQSLY